DFHAQEERRLFYVGMTRARDLIYFTSAEDMGGTRRWKVSQFVLEALHLPKEAARPVRARAIEELIRHAPPPEGQAGVFEPLPPDADLAVSHYQGAGYLNLPLKNHST